MIHYGFSKAAQLAIARGCAELTKGSNVTVNSVLPGPTWVEELAASFEKRAKAKGTTVEALQRQMFSERPDRPQPKAAYQQPHKHQRLRQHCQRGDGVQSLVNRREEPAEIDTRACGGRDYLHKELRR
jgi:NAD(P)-dependent dehydrogenase (short-subunit alcohol dehydrogenase family)